MTRLLLDVLERWEALQPGAPALAERRRVVTYGMLCARLRREISALEQPRTAGWVIHPMQTNIDAVISLIARLSVGYRLVLTDPALTSAESDMIKDVLAAAAPEQDPADHPAYGLVTSGTTGKPKVVSRDLASAIDNSRAFIGAIGCYRPGERVLCAAPLHHAYGLGAGMFAAMLSGGCLTPLAPSSGTALATVAARHQCTICVSVPFVYAAAVTSGARWPDSVKHCISAGDRLTPELSDRMRSLTGVAPTNHYGCTECGFITVAEPGDTRTVGRLVPGVTARTDAADHTSAGVLSIGLPPGYSRVLGADATLGEGRQWVVPGDRAMLDSAGRLVLLGRTDTVVTYAGKQVDLSEIENAFDSHPLVRACKVVPVGAQVDGLIAYVETLAGLDELSLRRHLARNLTPYKVPSRIVFLDELPRTRTGKIKTGLLYIAAGESR